MTALTHTPTTTDLSGTGYQPQHTPPRQPHHCYCGQPATGTTLYHHHDQLTAVKHHCPQHLPTRAATYHEAPR